MTLPPLRIYTISFPFPGKTKLGILFITVHVTLDLSVFVSIEGRKGTPL